MENKTERYQRHELIDWFPQQAVHDAKVAVIGCGAVGNEVAKNLALLGVGYIDLYDFDTIEIHNLTKSVLFRENDVGELKVEVAKQRLVELEPNITVNAFHGDVWELLSFRQLESYSCVLCCVDNFEARIKLNKLCLISGTPLINTGIDSKYCQIEAYPFGVYTGNACYECALPLSVYDKVQERYSCGWLKKVAFQEKKIPTTIITSSITGSLATSFAMSFIKGDFNSETTRILQNSMNGQASVSKLIKNDQCPCCSELHDKPVIISGARHILELSDDFGCDIDSLITSSEPIIVSAECSICGVKNETVEFTRASDSDSSLMWCKECKTESVLVDIKDYFTLRELKEHHLNKTFPGKFVQMQTQGKTIIIELKDN
ncbi:MULTISPECIES: HesA/MoeB/ThiF family protein [Vibrio harveyi group]|uniref:HesA/MoeB/ThiF family protein n=1 Tax=Vibrio harveyi group TaxID=717610 RepID=UPI001BD66D10|nr:ThiF family adenylyltransferase [Vibrio alginolyticus]MBT0032527.1 ThiF family adenylyltransferase [Vibrio alginolyticus]MBY4650368.1 ThiF family adenylyltransferase [Vibrio alginolyticus]